MDFQLRFEISISASCMRTAGRTAAYYVGIGPASSLVLLFLDRIDRRVNASDQENMSR